MKSKNLFLVLSLLFSALLGTAPAQTAGFGNALSFNGVNQYVSIPNFGNIIPTNEITVEFWADASVLAQQSAFMLNPDVTTDRLNGHISYINGDTYWDFGNIHTAGRAFAASPPSTVGNWVHYALVASKSGNYMKIYLNGNLLVSSNSMTPFVRGSYDLCIGGNTSYFFNGLLDDFRVWNVARTQAQIQSDLGTTLTGSEANLLLYYQFDSSSGTVATNSAVATGSAYNGTLVNSPSWVASGAGETVVTTNVDSGAGSLRWAVTNAIPGTTITFATNLSGQSILLTSGPLTLSNNLSLDASALPGGVTLSGGGSQQIFNVDSGATVSLLCLTLAQGNAADAGGAIYTAPGSTLNIARCTFTGNNALEGGAILNDGVLQVQNSTFSGNYGAYGGALQCRGLATLTHCTISANNGQNCGGIYNKDTTLTLNNCIIAANTDLAQAADLYSENAALVLVNANLIQSFGSTSPTNLSGPARLTSAPLLAALGNYGGPTQTMPPQSDSPAVDVGGSTSLTVDQRGFPRVIGPAPDLGAVELNYSNAVVSTVSDSGIGSLRYIVSYAPAGAMITFATTLSGQSIVLTSGQIVVTNSLTIDASALPAGMGINGNQSSRLFCIGTNASVVLTCLTLTGGFVGGTSAVLGSGMGGSDAMGGGIYNAGTLTLNRTTLAYNTALGGNGATADSDNGGNLYNPELYPGAAYGGGIYNVGNLNLIESTVAMNFAIGGTGGSDTVGEAISGGNGFAGGVFQAGQCTNQLTQSTISANSALAGTDGTADYVYGSGYGSGGGIGSDGNANEVLLLTNSILAGNSASSANADVYWPDGFADNPGNFVGGNPDLAALGNYGGPTPTMPPTAASPAIDAGNDSATNLFAIDQRGWPRLSGRHVDSGAVEVTVGMPAITGLGASLTGTNAGSGTLTVQLTATVTPNSEINTLVSFQYGVSPAYGLASGPSSLPGNFVSQSPPAGVTATSVGMSSGITLHWNVVAWNGAYTNTSPDQTLTLPSLGIPGDLNGDGVVNQADLAILLAHLNGNGTVNQSELNAVYSSYLTTSPWLYLTNVAGLGGTNVTFSLSSLIAGGYSVQYSTNLVNWYYLGPANLFYGFTDTNAPASPIRYYRLTYP